MIHKVHLTIRDIPRLTLSRLEMAAAAEEKTVRDFVLALLHSKIQELEKQGPLPPSQQS